MFTAKQNHKRHHSPRVAYLLPSNVQLPRIEIYVSSK